MIVIGVENSQGRSLEGGESRRAGIARRFLACARGNFSIVFAAATPLLLIAVGTAVDYALYFNLTSRAQASADAAAIAGAKALSMADATRESVSAVVDAVVQSYLQKGPTTQGSLGFTSATEIINVPGKPMQVAVKLSGPSNSLFAAPFGLGDWTVELGSVAEVVGSPNVCVLALEKSEPGALWLEKSARMTGHNCSVYSNSASSLGLVVRDQATLTAATVCSAGGAEGKGSVEPEALVDCPHFDDPLAGRPEPAVGSCTYSKLVIQDQTMTLSPGVYCGGLEIKGSSKVTLLPGTYVIKDGTLQVKNTSQLVGENVGFFFTGTFNLLIVKLGSSFFFDPDTVISLTAPKQGEMAGLLFYGSRSLPNATISTILSNNAQVLLGTIYMPTSSLVIDSAAQVGHQSAYTAIVARRVVLMSGPDLVLNTNYDRSDVPVPAGIRGAGQGVSLVK